MCKLTVVSPVYKANPQTVHDPLQSLFNQTLGDIEFIFVDDVCTDGTMDIIKEYAAADRRIKILRNEKNLGVGLTRNKGLAAASGEYVAPFDIDDFVDADFYEKLCAKADEDILPVAKGSVYTYNYGSRFTSSYNRYMLAQLRSGDKRVHFYGEHWTAVYKRKFLTEHGICYGSTRRGSDTTYLLRLSYYLHSIGFVDDVFYHYKVNENSITTALPKEYSVDYLLECVEFIQKVRTEENREHYNKYILDRINYEVNKINQYIERGGEINDSLKKCLLQLEIINKKYILN